VVELQLQLVGRVPSAQLLSDAVDPQRTLWRSSRWTLLDKLVQKDSCRHKRIAKDAYTCFLKDASLCLMPFEDRKDSEV